MDVPIGTIAAIICTITWIIAGTISKKASTDLGTHMIAFFYMIFGLVPIIIATLVVGVFSIPLTSIILSLVCGLFLTLGFISAFKALHTESLASVTVLNELQPAVLVLLGLFVLSEKVTGIQIVSILMVFVGAVMIITNEKMTINKKLIPAVISSLCWTFYWVIMTYAITSAGTFVLPVLISRLVGVPFVLMYISKSDDMPKSVNGFMLKFKKNRAFMVLVVLTLIAAFCDGSGDAIFGITLQSPVLAIGAAIIALAPMMTAFFSFLLYKDKLTRTQLYGLVVMIIGALALSVY